MLELARRQSPFGLIRVLERRSDGARFYCIKSSVQTLMLPDGVSGFGYVHACKLLLAGARSALIIGGGGGSLATMLARRGCAVTVLDVDPAAEEIARTYFDLHDSVRWVTTDALSFMITQKNVFDAVVIDACDAEGLVAPFNNPNMLAAILRKVCPKGSLVINVVHVDGAPSWGEGVACALADRGLSATLYRAQCGWEGNELLHIRASGPTDGLTITDLAARPPEARTYLMSLQAVRAKSRKRKARSGHDG